MSIESPSEHRDIHLDELERECAGLRDDAARLQTKLDEARDEIMEGLQAMRASIEGRIAYMDEYFKSLPRRR